MLTLYAVEYSGDQQCFQHTVLVEYDKVPKDYKTWRQDDFFDTFLMSAITDGAKWFKIIYSRKIDLDEYHELAKCTVQQKFISIVVN